MKQKGGRQAWYNQSLFRHSLSTKPVFLNFLGSWPLWEYYENQGTLITVEKCAHTQVHEILHLEAHRCGTLFRNPELGFFSKGFCSPCEFVHCCHNTRIPLARICITLGCDILFYWVIQYKKHKIINLRVHLLLEVVHFNCLTLLQQLIVIITLILLSPLTIVLTQVITTLWILIWFIYFIFFCKIITSHTHRHYYIFRQRNIV